MQSSPSGSGILWRRAGAGKPPNPRMQPTGRGVPSSARALRPFRTKRNEGLCGRQQESPQLMRKSLGRNETSLPLTEILHWACHL
jgi:hypothetical protein